MAAAELGKRHYTLDDAMTAEQWILAGNWQYKKLYQLELSDFFPGKEQLITTSKRYVPLEIAQEREKSLRQEIARLKQENERIANETGQNKAITDSETINQDFYAMAMKAMDEKLALKARIEELEKIIRQSNKHYFINPRKQRNDFIQTTTTTQHHA